MEKSHHRKRRAQSRRCLVRPFQSSEKALFMETEQDTAWGGGHVTTWRPIQSVTPPPRMPPWAVPAARALGPRPSKAPGGRKLPGQRESPGLEGTPARSKVLPLPASWGF